MAHRIFGGPYYPTSRFLFLYRTMGKKCRGMRANWTQDMMQEALHLLRQGKSQRYVENRCGIPRRTLRNHMKTGDVGRKLGANATLNTKQEGDLVKKIIRFSEIGFPLTPKALRRSVYKYAEHEGIQHRFNTTKETAGRDWYKAFMKRHPCLSQRKAQAMNPARAAKLNPYIVDDYFVKLGNILEKYDLKHQPSKIYNMDEKGCRLTLHHQQTVIAQKGNKRVHLVAPEHAENCTIVACANALGNSVPPMILFKGQRLKPTFADGLPPGSKVVMSPKGSMTTNLFIDWLNHFSKFIQPPVLLIFDGAASHLDLTIVEAADQLGIHLLCLPSNTTHELQPLDKSVFRSFEHFWDEQLLQYWDKYPDRKMNKERFSEVFTPVWGKCMTISNITHGFRATGIYPFDKSVIPEHAYAPSFPTRKEEEDDAEDVVPLATLKRRLKKQVTPEKENSFSKILVTPDMKPPERKNVRKKALNYKAQEVTKDIFCSRPKEKPTPDCSVSKGSKKPTGEPQPSCSYSAAPSSSKESWFCVICDEDRIADMRQCKGCQSWMHEECLGLSKDDLEDVTCLNCSD